MSPPLPAERWTLRHVLLVLAVAAPCAWLRVTWPAALVGAGSLVLLVIGELRAVAGPARIGAANIVTLARVGLVVLLAVRLGAGSGPIEAALIALVIALDGVDGWLARRTGSASELGARLDMESDALFVLVCALGLYACGRLPAFVLVPGSLRYLYVLALRLWPRLRGEAPRSQLGRVAFLLMVLSFAVSAWPLFPQHAQLALIASAGIAASFARSVYWSLRNV